MGDDLPTDTPTGRWMTYDEIAATRGIKRSGAVRLVQRQRWRRQAGNDGYARVLVPHDEQHPVRGTRPHVNLREGGDDGRGDGGGDIAATFEAALTVIREAHAGEIATLRDMVGGLRDTVARAETRAVHAEQRAIEAEAVSAAKDVRVTQAEAEADRARGVAREALQAAETLRTSVDELKAGQTMMQDMHVRELEQARAAAQLARDAAASVRQADEARKARGRWARLRAAWRGE
jgi:hypothetical protein